MGETFRQKELDDLYAEKDGKYVYLIYKKEQITKLNSNVMVEK